MKLLSRYLDSRRGDCVSMPILFLILADRLGLDVSLSTRRNAAGRDLQQRRDADVEHHQQQGSYDDRRRRPGQRRRPGRGGQSRLLSQRLQYPLDDARRRILDQRYAGPDGHVVHIVADPVYQARAYLGGVDSWLPTAVGQSAVRLAVDINAAGHEFAHNFGLKDPYHNGRPDPGYAGSIMGDGYNSPPNDKTASEMMTACEHPQQ